VKGQKVNWAEYVVYDNSKKCNLEASYRNKLLQLGIVEKIVLLRPLSIVAVFSEVLFFFKGVSTFEIES